MIQIDGTRVNSLALMFFSPLLVEILNVVQQSYMNTADSQLRQTRNVYNSFFLLEFYHCFLQSVHKVQ